MASCAGVIDPNIRERILAVYAAYGPVAAEMKIAELAGGSTTIENHLRALVKLAPVVRGSKGRKDDSEKLPLHLIPPEFLYAIAEILAFGAKKYAPRNWEKGLNWSRVYRAAIGHLFDWFMRKGPDVETGKSHLWHAACCIMFLVCYEIRGSGTDDRPT